MDISLGTIDLFCSSCNVQVEAQVLARHAIDSGGDPADPVDTLHDITQFVFAACKRCKGPFVTRQNFSEVPGEFSLPSDDAIQVYPQKHDIPLDSVPKTARKTYLEAQRAYCCQLFESCVIMCRKCVEAVCNEYGESEKPLAQCLRRLQSHGIIDQNIFQWANGVRMVGNDAAHDLKMQITKTDAKDALDFTEAVLLYVFVFQRRFSEFQKRREEAKESSSHGTIRGSRL